MPLERVKRHMRAISSDQECRVSPRVTSCASPDWRNSTTARRKRGTIVAMPPHQRDRAAVFRADLVDLPPAGQKMVIDAADHVKPIGDDHRLGKCLLAIER